MVSCHKKGKGKLQLFYGNVEREIPIYGGHPAYIMTYPCLDLTVSVSSLSFGYQLPAKYSSTLTSIYLPSTGISIPTLSHAPFRYLTNHILNFTCYFLGKIEKQAHW